MSGSELAAIVAVAVLGFWILGAYNRLVRLRQDIAAAFAQVDAEFRLRHDLLAELVAAATAELNETPEAVAAVDAARLQARVAADRAVQRPASAGRIASLALAEQVLRTALRHLITLAKSRPALRGDAQLRAVLKQLSATQHRLTAARQGYNASVLVYNASAQQFPTRLVAAMFGFRAAGRL